MTSCFNVSDLSVENVWPTHTRARLCIFVSWSNLDSCCISISPVVHDSWRQPVNARRWNQKRCQNGRRKEKQNLYGKKGMQLRAETWKRKEQTKRVCAVNVEYLILLWFRVKLHSKSRSFHKSLIIIILITLKSFIVIEFTSYIQIDVSRKETLHENRLLGVRNTYVSLQWRVLGVAGACWEGWWRRSCPPMSLRSPHAFFMCVSMCANALFSSPSSSLRFLLSRFHLHFCSLSCHYALFTYYKQAL